MIVTERRNIADLRK